MRKAEDHRGLERERSLRDQPFNNQFSGIVRRRDGQTWFAVGGGPLLGPLADTASDPPFGWVPRPGAALIRAGYLRLGPPAGLPGSINNWSAFVSGVVVGSTHVDVLCRGGGSWQAGLSLSGWRDLQLAVGDPVTVSVGPENIHLIPG